MRTNKLLSFLTAAAIAVSGFTGLVLSAGAATKTYTWDFTSESFFPVEIAAGSDVISDQGEETAIMSLPTAKLSRQEGKVTNASGASVQVAKTEIQGDNALKLTIPDCDSAVFKAELTTGSTGKAIIIKDESGSEVFNVSDYTKNVLKEYSVELDGSKTYVFDTTAYKIYLGKVTLTLTTSGGEPDEPTEETTDEPTDEPTEETTDEPTAETTQAPDSGDIAKLMSETFITFDSFSGNTYEADTMLTDSLKLYAGEGKNANVVVDGSNKTIDGEQFTTRLKFGGTGQLDAADTPIARVLEVVPGTKGSLTVYFAHASSSGDARAITIAQGGKVIGTQSVDANSLTSYTVNVDADKSVYIYSTVGGTNVYGIKYVPGETVTPNPTAAPTAAPTQEPEGGTPAPGSDELIPITADRTITFDAYSGITYSETALIANGYMKVYATSGATLVVDGSNKTIGSTKYTTRMKMGGTATLDADNKAVARVLEIMPGTEGTLTVDFAHASSSGDARTLVAVQDGGQIGSEAVDAGATGTLSAEVTNTESSIYIYSTSGGLNVYGVTYKAGKAEPTPVPTQEPSSADTAKADADALKINAISQTAIYYDIDLPKTGNNGSTITWESSDSNYIDIQMVSSIKRNWTGVVTRPKVEDPNIEDGGVPVTLTATVENGGAKVTKEFKVSVRTWNPNVYYNDFQQDVGMSAEGTYKEISDNVIPVTPKKIDLGTRIIEDTGFRSEPFRGISVDTLKESRAFDAFRHNDTDTTASFDKRIMSTNGTSYGNPKDSDPNEENFVFYYSEYYPYGGTSTIPMWITLTDPATGSAPEGIVMMSMDIYVADGFNQFNIGLANSSPAQMCRFMLGADSTKTLSGSLFGEPYSYSGAGYFRSFNSETGIDYLGGSGSYRHPVGKWVKLIMIANTDSKKWDVYYDGMLIGSSLNFRNAEDCVSNIEFVLNRSYPRNDTSSRKDTVAVYLMDNIYVENLTEDYADTYWDAVGIDSLPYDEETDTYTATAGTPFLLQYQGTAGLSGNLFSWASLDKNALTVRSQTIAVDKLIDYGYTQAQIDEIKKTGRQDVYVNIATPAQVDKETTVTLRATITVGDDELDKEFTVIIKPSETGAATPTPTVKPSTPSSSGGGGGG
ncbi:MAG: immunoglobulin-like domain-containing protein, partial [Candidatus Ornithomonoglobus sp.]